LVFFRSFPQCGRALRGWSRERHFPSRTIGAGALREAIAEPDVEAVPRVVRTPVGMTPPENVACGD